ncbi:MAG: pyruvate ferredoxin oxidoreductase [candidate division Zixibacteria bacterium]|nr:pyruvate ferredoxin oxidoreductase [candidate division Zixibacteria bacterium]
MKEITFFGRGGQGAVVASEILANAYFHEGYNVQCFPSFGVERRGAPVTAFLRVDEGFIYLRSMIYRADFGLVLAPDIVNAPTFKPSLKDKSTILVNAKEKPSQLSEFNLSYVDATGIALEYNLGSKAQPLVNTSILGAFAKICCDLKLDNLLRAVEEKVPMKTRQNLKAVTKAYESVVSGE